MFPQIFGKYVLEREMAGGGMARVYLATLRGAVGFEKRLVVKQIRPELASDDAFVRRFIEEAKTAVELGHPNIVPVYELGVEQGIYYIAMELCEGVTLSELLRATGKLSPDEGAYVGIEICRALDYAHRKAEIVHRDVTPRNVMIDEEGAVRLIDFGIAAPVTIDGAVQSELFGSPGHMPPEQVHGGTLTPASDVFAVAVLLVEAWTDRPPFRRTTPEACLEALDKPVPSITEHDEELEPVAELIAAALSLEAEERPESAEALARPLRDFVKTSDLGDLSRRLGARVRSVRRQQRASQPAIDEAITSSQIATAQEQTPTVDMGVEVTRTFAARDEMVEWTRKLPSIPPPKDDDAEHADDAERAEDAERASDTDVTSPTTSSQRGASPQRSSNLGRFAVIGAIGAAVVGVIALRGPATRTTTPATAAPDAAAVTSEKVKVPKAPASLPKAPVSAPAPKPTKKPKTPNPSLPLAPSGSAAPVGRAYLNLTSTPPATVTVAGRSQTTPVMGMELPAGNHFVQFKSTVLDERVPAQVKLAPGQTKTVHADFTGASPRVHIR